MKVLQVSDVHGDKTPLELAKKYINEVDMVVFPGDYADSFDNKWNDQKPILMQILDFKKENPDKVKVLLGNHDIAYLIGEIVSGHQLIFAYDIEEYLQRNAKLFSIVFVQDNWIFSHAGVSKEWMVNKGLNSLEDIND
jgi:predicted phosphodiesterase